MRGLMIFAILAGPALAHADTAVFPLELPPMYYVDGAGTVAASVTTNVRAISAQYDFAESNLFAIGGGGVIDETTYTYSLQIHMALGKRFLVFDKPIMDTGRLRIGIDARVLGETIFTQPGKDDDYVMRFAFDGGVGAWAVTPKGVHMGTHIGFEAPFSDPASRPTEIVASVMVAMPYGEPDPHAVQNEAAAVDKMLTTDPHNWPEHAYTGGGTIDNDVTLVSVGIVWAVPTSDSSMVGGTMMTFDQRLMLAVGVMYP